MKQYIGVRMVENLKWGRKDKEETQSGSYYNRGYHIRDVKTRLKQSKKKWKRNM